MIAFRSTGTIALFREVMSLDLALLRHRNCESVGSVRRGIAGNAVSGVRLVRKDTGNIQYAVNVMKVVFF